MTFKLSEVDSGCRNVSNPWMTRVDDCMTTTSQVMHICCHEPGKSEWIWCGLTKKYRTWEEKEGKIYLVVEAPHTPIIQIRPSFPHRANLSTTSLIITSHSSTLALHRHIYFGFHILACLLGPTNSFQRFKIYWAP